MISGQSAFGWGFFGHKRINLYAIFLLPPEMIAFFKTNSDFITEHAVDPDKRRYAVPQEAPRHYIDINHYGTYPYDSLPRKWTDAAAKFSVDTLNKYGIVPWWIQTMLYRLTEAFKERNSAKILRYASDIGHYIGDAHVPLHANSNHNGQYTGQKGIHGFWESRIPELLADSDWDFLIGRSIYIAAPADFIWRRILESAAAADTVLAAEKELSEKFPADKKFSFEWRNGKVIRQYSASFSRAYDKKLGGMIERRMRQSVFAVASFWYTAWINAGQPSLKDLTNSAFTAEELQEFILIEQAWKSATIKGREHESPHP